MSLIDQTSLALNRVNRCQRRLTALQNSLVDETYKTDADLIPAEDDAFDLGSTTERFKDLHLSNNANVGNNVTVTGATKLSVLKTSETPATTSYGDGDTLDAIDLVNGIIVIDTSSTDIALSVADASAIVGVVSDATAGDVVRCLIVANGANAITLSDSGDATSTITNGNVAGNSSRVFYIRLVSVEDAAEEVVFY